MLLGFLLRPEWGAKDLAGGKRSAAPGDRPSSRFRPEGAEGADAHLFRPFGALQDQEAWSGGRASLAPG